MLLTIGIRLRLVSAATSEALGFDGADGGAGILEGGEEEEKDEEEDEHEKTEY